MKTKTTAATSVPASRARAHLTAAPYLCIRYTKIYSACLSIFHLKNIVIQAHVALVLTTRSVWNQFGIYMDR